MNLYELTRKLVARGCPEPPRLKHMGSDLPHQLDRRWYLDEGIRPLIDDSDARAIWTCWALEWFLGLCRNDDKSHEYIELLTWTTHKCTTLTVTYETVGEKFKPPYESCVDGDWSILEAIEAATRHLEPQ